MEGRGKADIAPGLLLVLQDLAARGIATPDPADVGISEARRRNLEYFDAIAGKPPPPARSETVDVTGETGATVPVRVVVPAAMRAGAPALLYLHGGGYAFGDLATHDHIFRWLADLSGMTVFGLHYRRTPEEAYPAQVHDALAAVAAIRGSVWPGRYGHDPQRLMLFGDSAGAHLCMSLMLMLKARGLAQPSGAALAYGMYARRFDTWSHLTYGDGSYGLSSQRMGWFWDQLLAGHPGGPDPVAEPLLSDLTGLPPLALYGAECDCLLDDTRDFRALAQRAGHPHSFHLFPNMTHGFLHLASTYRPSRDALALITQDLKRMAG
jgi:acetyl esterase